MSSPLYGPWRLSPCNCRLAANHAVINAAGDIVTAVDILSGYPEREAQARLIAAAPDLLAACKAAWPMLDRAADQLADDEACEESGRVADACATFAMDLRAAILKAEGGVK